MRVYTFQTEQLAEMGVQILGEVDSDDNMATEHIVFCGKLRLSARHRVARDAPRLKNCFVIAKNTSSRSALF